MYRTRLARAFTIIELIVVIVIIGILAAIAAVAYNVFIDHAHESAAIQVAEQVERTMQARATNDRTVVAPGTRVVLEPGGVDPVLDLNTVYPDLKALPIKQVTVEADGQVVVVTQDRRCVNVSFTPEEVASSAQGTWSCPLGDVGPGPDGSSTPTTPGSDLAYQDPADGGALVTPGASEDIIAFVPGSDSVTVTPRWNGTDAAPTNYTISPGLPSYFSFDTSTAAITGPSAQEWGLKASSVSAGTNHTCAVTTAHTVVCWGSNGGGALGVGTYSSPPGTGQDVGSVLPITVINPDGTQFIGVNEVSAGDGATCAVKSDGTVWCWGDNRSAVASGSGDPSIQESTISPVRIPGLSGVEQVSTGIGNACALKSNGDVWCWGAAMDHDYGSNWQPPVKASLPGNAISVATGSSSACAAMQDGDVYCWGDVPGLGYSASPVKVSSISSATSVTAAGSVAYCAVISGGRVSCWGQDNNGTMGNPSIAGGNTGDSPVMVLKANGDALTGVTSLALNENTSCARLTSGQAWCWGSDYAGARGDGAATTLDSTEPPTQVFGLDNFTQVSGGGQRWGYGHMCGLLTDATIRCWGDYKYGEIGDGTLPGGTAPSGATYPQFRENPALVPVPTDALTSLPRSLTVSWLAPDGSTVSKAVQLQNAPGALVNVPGNNQAG